MLLIYNWGTKEKMSLDKGIQHHKEHRKEYRGSKAIDPSCRCHGGCDWCLANRLHKYRKKQLQLEQKEQEYLDGEETGEDTN